MNISTTIRFDCFTILLLATQFLAAAQNGFTDADVDAIQAFLRANLGNTNAGMVIGLVDERGSRVLAVGKLDNGTPQEVNSDTVFEIGSVTKTFTTLLLQDMVERGEVKLDDPVAKYLPASVKVPARNGKRITLLDLATHTSGLPRDPSNLTPGHGLPENAFADYTVEKLYAFLSSFALDREPGAKFEYSNVGMALLGHILVLKTGTNYEGLVVERICRPLKMNSTRITLTPQLRARLARGHDQLGKPAPNWEFQVYDAAGGLRSTANDLMKYVSANLGLTPSSLTSLMQRTHVIRHKQTSDHGDTAMAWYDRGAYQPPGMELIGHAGATGGYGTFIGFDKRQRGVVVLTTANDVSPEAIGWTLLQRLPLKRENANEFAKEIVGLGFTFDLDQTHMLRITKVYPKSSAGQAGLSSGLIIQKINAVPTAGKSIAECFNLLRANGSPKVRLELVNPERKETNTVELTRGKFLTAG
jgi:D-alanyl-D-alanine-carboxypeptidase/D-alanyl-D-alanine-endopeptidase